MTTYSNPRMEATIEGWPSGGKRITARFYIEQNVRGERAIRITDGKPKKTTYARQVRIVDGDDGRTYIAERTGYGWISIMRGDMKFQHENIMGDDPRIEEAMAWFR